MFNDYFKKENEYQEIKSPLDESKPSFKKTLKCIFKDVYDMTGVSKLKPTQELVLNLIQKKIRVVILAIHLSFLTGMEDWLSRNGIDFLFIGSNISDEYK